MHLLFTSALFHPRTGHRQRRTFGEDGATRILRMVENRLVRSSKYKGIGRSRSVVQHEATAACFVEAMSLQPALSSRTDALTSSGCIHHNHTNEHRSAKQPPAGLPFSAYASPREPRQHPKLSTPPHKQSRSTTHHPHRDRAQNQRGASPAKPGPGQEEKHCEPAASTVPPSSLARVRRKSPPLLLLSPSGTWLLLPLS